MDKRKLPTPKELMELSNKGKEEFKQIVLNGKTFKEIITCIEESALKGYTGWQRKIYSDSNLRELRVIRDYLNENGFKSELKSERKIGALGLVYYEYYFVVDWNEK